jgi:hypothetical protein
LLPGVDYGNGASISTTSEPPEGRRQYLIYHDGQSLHWTMADSEDKIDQLLESMELTVQAYQAVDEHGREISRGMAPGFLIDNEGNSQWPPEWPQSWNPSAQPSSQPAWQVLLRSLEQKIRHPEGQSARKADSAKIGKV